MIFRIADRLLETLLVFVLGAMSLIVAANVFCRFVLGFSLYWGDEAAQSLLVWLTFLGAALAVRERAHYSFDMFERVASGTLSRVLGLTSRVITIVALVGLFAWSLEVAIGIHPWIMPAMGISRTWVYAAGPVGCAFMLLYAGRDFIRTLRGPAAASATARAA